MRTTLTSYIRYVYDIRCDRGGALKTVCHFLTIVALAWVVPLPAAQALPFRVDEANGLAAAPPRLAARDAAPVRGPLLEPAEADEATSSPVVGDVEHVAGDCTSFTAGVRDCDQIFVINSRPIGTCCDPEILRSGLGCEAYAICGEGCRTWQPADLMSVLTAYDPTAVTIIYVHGNQISHGLAKCRGLMHYRRMIQCSAPDQPVRFVIFSWPSSEIHGVSTLKDARIKAARTRPAGCQLAWVIDQMPGDLPLALVGYSYGPRIITGALHILGGGTLSGLGLVERANPERMPVRLVFIAAALHAHWLGPGQYHGLAMSQVESLLLVNNCDDPAMKFYGLSTPHGSPQALGLRGPTCLGPADRHKVRCIDVSRYVGRKHEEVRYIHCVPGMNCRLWGELAVSN